jgi:DNA-binding NarL/FixJ family response regulator
MTSLDIIKSLSPTNQKVARMLIDGKSNKEIAAELNYATSHVGYIVATIYDAFGLADVGKSRRVLLVRKWFGIDS